MGGGCGGSRKGQGGKKKVGGGEEGRVPQKPARDVAWDYGAGRGRGGRWGPRRARSCRSRMWRAGPLRREGKTAPENYYRER